MAMVAKDINDVIQDGGHRHAAGERLEHRPVPQPVPVPQPSESLE